MPPSPPPTIPFYGVGHMTIWAGALVLTIMQAVRAWPCVRSRLSRMHLGCTVKSARRGIRPRARKQALPPQSPLRGTEQDDETAHMIYHTGHTPQKNLQDDSDSDEFSLL